MLRHTHFPECHIRFHVGLVPEPTTIHNLGHVELRNVASYLPDDFYFALTCPGFRDAMPVKREQRCGQCKENLEYRFHTHIDRVSVAMLYGYKPTVRVAAENNMWRLIRKIHRADTIPAADSHVVILHAAWAGNTRMLRWAIRNGYDWCDTILRSY